MPGHAGAEAEAACAGGRPGHAEESPGSGEAGHRREKPQASGAGMESPAEPCFLLWAFGARGENTDFFMATAPLIPAHFPVVDFALVVFKDAAILLYQELCCQGNFHSPAPVTEFEIQPITRRSGLRGHSETSMLRFEVERGRSLPEPASQLKHQ